MTPTHRKPLNEQGARLRHARESVGLSTRDFAKQLISHDINLSHATLGNYESGRTQAPDSVLRAYGQICQRPYEWLCGDGNRLVGAKYRALKATRVRTRKSFEGKAESLFNGMLWLEGLTGNRVRRLHISPFSPKQAWSGGTLAVKLREFLKIERYPLSSVNRLLFHFGVRVIDLEADLQIDALAARFGSHYVIAINSQLKPDRVRMTLLHELAHILYDDCSDINRLDHDEVESRAFDFASHLLIPEGELKKAIKKNSMIELVKCKERFGISLAAMLYRAHQSRLISQTVYRRIMIEFSKLGYRKREPGRVIEDRPIWFEVLSDSAIRSAQSTLEEIARRSGLLPSELVERMNNAVGVVPFEDQEDDLEPSPSSYKFEHYSKELDL